jgi:hypothetical protein
MKGKSLRNVLATIASVICLIHCAAVPFAWTLRPMLFEAVLLGGPKYAFMPVQPTGFETLTALWAVGYKFNVAAGILMLMVFVMHRHSDGESLIHRIIHWLALPFVAAVFLEPWVVPLHWVALLTSLTMVALQVALFVSSLAPRKPIHA